MNIASVKREVLESLRDPEYRHAFNLENVYTGLCFQIRALREQRELSQSGLGSVAKMAQERISILEDPNSDTKPTLNTLLRLANAFDVGLDVRFVPFGTVIDRSVQTNLKKLEVKSFDEELLELERAYIAPERSPAHQAEQFAYGNFTSANPTVISINGFKAKHKAGLSESKRKRGFRTKLSMFLANSPQSEDAAGQAENSTATGSVRNPFQAPEFAAS